MIVRGRFRTFGFWVSVISVIGGTFIAIYLPLNGIDNTPTFGKIIFFVAIFLLLSVYGKLFYDANLITIDTTTRTITFTNRFTRAKSTYIFSDFDGKLVSYKPIKGSWAKFLYLVKDERVVKKMTDFMYSNQKELEEALAEIKDLGTVKYSLIKTWKMLLNKPVLD